MLSGHGCYREYLYRFKHDDSPECPAGCGVVENAEHVFFECPRYGRERRKLEGALKATPKPETLVGMMASEGNWSAASEFATTIMKQLRTEELGRRARPSGRAATETE